MEIEHFKYTEFQILSQISDTEPQLNYENNENWN